MRILVLQHHPEEHPGVFRDFLAEDGIEWDAVELDAGETIPSLDGYAALWSFGGPMDVWQKADHPWIENEIAVLREAVMEREMPVLGVCLGHQLLAEALGGEVGPMERGEIGVLDVIATGIGASDPLFGSTDPQPVLQWHSAEVTALPPGAEALAESPVTAVQALRYGNHAYGIQYHVEVTSETVPAWGCIPEYKSALERTLGADALGQFEQDVSDNLAAFNASARRLYDGFKALMTQPTVAAE